MWNFCPSCGSPKIQFDQSHKFSCPACGFVYYHNTAAATGCVIRTKKGILLLVRGKDPAKGKLDLPGGFVDPGEGALDGLRRELREEIGWPGEGGACGGNVHDANFSLFASFPNTYPYKNIVYNTCDLFFTLDAPDLTEKDLRLDSQAARAANTTHTLQNKSEALDSQAARAANTTHTLQNKSEALDEGEIGGCCFVQPRDIRMEDLAFDSTRRALRAYLDNYG